MKLDKVIGKKMSEFWSALWSCTIGTVIGIVLTFGTTAYLEYAAQKDSEHTAALMVINNIDHFCYKLENDLSEIEREDSLNMVVGEHYPDRLDEMPDDVLQSFLNNLLSRNMSIIDNTAENIFSNNTDTWKNIANREFIENAGKCFSAKRMLVKMLDELDEDKRDVWNIYWTDIVYSSKKDLNLRQTVSRIFDTPSLCAFIQKQHLLYRSGLKSGLMALREHNALNKQLMEVTDKDLLKEFGKNHEVKRYR